MAPALPRIFRNSSGEFSGLLGFRASRCIPIPIPQNFPPMFFVGIPTLPFAEPEIHSPLPESQNPGSCSHLFRGSRGHIPEAPECQDPHQEGGILLQSRQSVQERLQQDQVVHHVVVEELEKGKNLGIHQEKSPGQMSWNSWGLELLWDNPGKIQPRVRLFGI